MSARTPWASCAKPRRASSIRVTSCSGGRLKRLASCATTGTAARLTHEVVSLRPAAAQHAAMHPKHMFTLAARCDSHEDCLLCPLRAIRSGAARSDVHGAGVVLPAGTPGVVVAPLMLAWAPQAWVTRRRPRRFSAPAMGDRADGAWRIEAGACRRSWLLRHPGPSSGRSVALARRRLGLGWFLALRYARVTQYLKRSDTVIHRSSGSEPPSANSKLGVYSPTFWRRRQRRSRSIMQ
jgi:hypothetical protein